MSVLITNSAALPFVAATGNTQTPSGSLGAAYQAVLFTIAQDTTGSYNATTGIYTVPYAGMYLCYSQLEIASTVFTLNDQIQTKINLNGSTIAIGGSFASTGIASLTAKFNCVVRCTVGDQLAIFSYFMSAGTPSYVIDTSGSNFYITRL